MANMHLMNRTAEPQKVRVEALSEGRQTVARLRGERGSAMIEFALVFPVMMIVVFGLFSMGLMLNQYLELTDAVAVGGQYLADLRSNTSNPCSDTTTVIENAAPMLTAASMNFSYTITSGSGNSTTLNSFPNTTTCAAGAAELSPLEPVSVTVTYPCTLQVYNNANVLPGCTLTASITEITQ